MLTNIAVIIVVALIGNLVFTRVKLPGILGMIVTGVALGPSGLDLIRPEVIDLLKEIKTLALIVILIRAGDDIYGQIDLDSDQSGAFTEDDEIALISVADKLAEQLAAERR